jgi:hypothetical protein
MDYTTKIDRLTILEHYADFMPHTFKCQLDYWDGHRIKKNLTACQLISNEYWNYVINKAHYLYLGNYCKQNMEENSEDYTQFLVYAQSIESKDELEIKSVKILECQDGIVCKNKCQIIYYNGRNEIVMLRGDQLIENKYWPVCEPKEHLYYLAKYINKDRDMLLHSLFIQDLNI